ncbi:hypothetical protein SSPNP10_22455 [Streptomyces sp. NP10]|nr:hypothetical protein SSPNP10_22455 [Streptomyces sp. NP10]
MLTHVEPAWGGSSSAHEPGGHAPGDPLRVPADTAQPVRTSCPGGRTGSRPRGAASRPVRAVQKCRSRPRIHWAANCTGPRVASVTRAVTASSAAICAAELLAPTTTSRPPVKGAGLRQSAACSTCPVNSARPGSAGRGGRPKVQGSRDDGTRPEPVATFEDHAERKSGPAYGGDAPSGADVGVQAVGIGGEMGHNLVAMRVAVPVGAGERHRGQGAVPGRREQREAVVVARPRPGRTVGCLQRHRPQRAGGGESGPAATDGGNVDVLREASPEFDKCLC